MIAIARILPVVSALAVWAGSGAMAARAQSSPAPQNIFHVKYIAEGAVYVDAGRNAGLKEGMILTATRGGADAGATQAVRFQTGDGVAQLRVLSVADTSAVCEILSSREDLEVGDIAYLHPQSIEQRTAEQNAEESKNYPIVVGFTYGDPLDEEIRETQVPHTMSPPVNSQMRGRIGFDYSSILESGGLNSNQIGFLVDANMTHIGGTYWNFTGYWRGRLTTQSTGGAGGVSPTTLTDLINRTYHAGFYYQNPDSPITAGIGRLYLPWAPSLSTIDGGYFGRKISREFTTGFFAGSTPDPTSWSYAPNQRIAGVFVNYETGNFDSLHFTSTAGLAATSIDWHIAREFAFFENTFSVTRTLSIYNSLQADKARTAAGGVHYGTGLTQSFTTVRYQPAKRFTFSLNDNYLRNLPTFNPALIGTGLLDQYLFQGLSGGVRVEIPWHAALYTTLGKSSTSTNNSHAWNQLYGATFEQLFNTGLRLDAHYSEFNSSFGQGNYTSFSLSKNLTDKLRLEGQSGWQTFNSPLTNNTHSHFINGLVDWNFGPRYFFEGLFSWNQGTALNYKQAVLTVGYRFGGYRTR